MEGKLSGSVLVKSQNGTEGDMRAAAHDCVPGGAPEPQQPARAPSETDCPAARGPPRRIRATGAAEIEMTAPKAALGLLRCGRQRL